MQPDDIVAMTQDGTARGARQPSSEWRFHRDIYAARADAHAIVHAHSPFATTLACLGRDIPAFHYMIAVAGGNDIRCAPYATFGTQELSDHALARARRAQGLPPRQSRHDRRRRRRSPQALALAVEVEALAEQYWRALQIGEPTLLSDAEMAVVLEKFRTYGEPR